MLILDMVLDLTHVDFFNSNFNSSKNVINVGVDNSSSTDADDRKRPTQRIR